MSTFTQSRSFFAQGNSADPNAILPSQTGVSQPQFDRFN